MSATCDVCWHHCHLKDGQVGACHARVGTGQAVVSKGYGKLTSVAVDPIEKKPLARFLSGTSVLSLGGFGCNLHCPWCQNHTISQVGEEGVGWRESDAEGIRALAVELHERDVRMCGVAYTYNEPLVSYEYVRDCARLVHESGLVNVLVSAGSVSEHVAREVAPLMDAANIDLKSSSAETYARIGGDLGQVQSTISCLHEAGCHVEVTTLVVPGVNDTEEEIAAIASWIAGLDPSICYHVTRFFGAYRMRDVPATPRETVFTLARVARRYLSDVVVGNV